MTKQKRSELPQDEIICPYCNEVQQFHYGTSIVLCDNDDCMQKFSCEVIKRPDLFITKPL